MPPHDSSLALLSERLPLIVSPHVARQATQRLAPAAQRLHPRVILESLQLFAVPRGGAPQRRLQLLEILLFAKARLTPDDPAAALAATLCARGLPPEASTFAPGVAARALEFWTDLEHFRLDAGLEKSAHTGLFAAFWAQAIAEAADDALTALNSHWLCRKTLLKRVGHRVRHLAPLLEPPSQGPLFAGETRLTRETGLILCSQSAESWLFLSPWGQAVAAAFAPHAPAPGLWRSAERGPATGGCLVFFVMGRTVRLPDILTSRAMAAFRAAFAAVDAACRLNPSRHRYFGVGRDGVFLPDAMVAEPALLWAEFFLAAGVVQSLSPHDPYRADDIAPAAVRRYDVLDEQLHVGHLFLYTTGRETPSRLEANALNLKSDFLTEETSRRPLAPRPFVRPRRRAPKKAAPASAESKSGFTADDRANLAKAAPASVKTARRRSRS